MLWITAAVAHAGCVVSFSAEEIRAAMDAAQVRLGADDVRGYGAAMDSLDVDLPCLADVMPTADAALLHRLVGKRAVLDGDPDLALAAFAAAARLDPHAELLHAESEAQALYATARGTGDALVGIGPDPKGRVVWIDGAPADGWHAGHASLVQLADATGAVVDTHYAWPFDPPPGIGMPLELDDAPVVLHPCDDPVPAAELERLARTASAAVEDRDDDAFSLAVATALDGARCAVEPLPTSTVAALHGVLALEAYMAGDRATAVRAFVAARLADPRFSVADTDAAVDLAELFGRARGRPGGPGVALRPPPTYTTLVDGAPSPTRPLLRPSWVQLVDARGQVVWTHDVPAGVVGPAWSEALYRPLSARAPHPAARRRSGAVIALTSIGLGAAGAVWYQQLLRAGETWYPVYSADEARAYRRSLQGQAGIAAGLTLTGAVGLGAGAAILATAGGAR